MKLLILLQLVSFALIANDQKPIELSTVKNEALRSALGEAFSEGHFVEQRAHSMTATTAYSTEVQNHDSLRSFPQETSSFRIAVFEKRSRIEEKNNINVKLPEIAKFNNPEIYQFDVKQRAQCSSFKKQKKWNAKRFFHQANNNQQCLILYVSKKQKRKQFFGEVVSALVFLDKNYKAFGKRIFIHQGRKKMIFKDIFINSKQSSLYSDFSGFPLDIPNLKLAVNKTQFNVKDSLIKPRTPSLLARLRNLKLKKIRSRPLACRRGLRGMFKSHFRNNINFGWCQKDAWPTTIETRNYWSLLISQN